VWTFVFLIAIVGLMIFGASLYGISVNPAPAGFAVLAGSVLVPAAMIAPLVIYVRGSGMYVDSTSVGRINLFGNPAGGSVRSDVVGVAVHKGSYARWVLPEPEPEENTLWLKLRNGGTAMRTNMYFYSISQAQGLAAVLGVPFEIV
ncbi:MAG TPA: hypothetical protein VHQ03_13190, partial [Candidatus Dormibacteraeota bacterium]|nr:hypothetical protein [Candidatus Dormibacteraeota bacterium]